jgi:hypothetical protein
MRQSTQKMISSVTLAHICCPMKTGELIQTLDTTNLGSNLENSDEESVGGNMHD